MTRGGVGRWTRLRIGLQVLVAVVLAVGAAVLLVDLSDWKYVRFDLSASGRNTVDPTLLELIDGLPQETEVDVFFRPLERPYDAVSVLAQNRVLDLLFVLHNARRDRFDVTIHRPQDHEENQARQRELGVEGANILVVGCGGRRTTLDLFRDVVTIDWGNPTVGGMRYLLGEGIVAMNPGWSQDPSAFVPPRRELQRFRGPEAVAEALLKVTAGRPPRVYFAAGHGEGDPMGTTTATDLGLLRNALLQDGFEVEPWDAARDGPVPTDCEVLALIGAHQPYLVEELEAVREYVAGGGRVIAAPSFEDFEMEVEERASGAPGDAEEAPDGLAGLLSGYGMLPQPGIVNEALGGRVEEDYRCASLSIGESGLNRSHAITIPLRQHDWRVQFSFTHSFGRGELGRGGSQEDLISSPPNAWRDLRDPSLPGAIRDHRFDRTREERGRWSLCKVAYLRGGGARPEDEGRVLGIASAGFCGNLLFSGNRDFLLNAFNWMAARDYRIQVQARDAATSHLDVARGWEITLLSYLLGLGLPGASILVGIVVAWRRRR